MENYLQIPSSHAELIYLKIINMIITFTDNFYSFKYYIFTEYPSIGLPKAHFDFSIILLWKNLNKLILANIVQTSLIRLASQMLSSFLLKAFVFLIQNGNSQCICKKIGS